MEQLDMVSPQNHSMGMGERIIGIFTKPTQTLQSLKSRPDFLIPLLLGVLFFALFLYANQDLMVQESIRSLAENERIPEEIRNQRIDFMENIHPGQKMLFFVGFPLGGMILVYFALGLIFWVTGTFILGGKARYTQVQSAYGYSYLIPGVVGLVFKWILILLAGSLHVYTSLAAILPLEQEKTFLFKVLDLFDIFYLWWVYVFGLGLAIMNSWDARKGWMVVGIIYFAYGLIKALL